MSIKVLSVQDPTETKHELWTFIQQIRDAELVAQATNPCEALDCLKVRDVDIVLFDMGSPSTGGIEITRKIRAEFSDVRVLVVTASDQPEDIFAAMDAGADGYILEANLATALESALRSVRLGAVWLDPGIARQVLLAMEIKATTPTPTRILPTGLMTIPLLPEEKTVLEEVASSSCVDGVCLIDPSFLKRLQRFSAAS